MHGFPRVKFADVTPGRLLEKTGIYSESLLIWGDNTSSSASPLMSTTHRHMLD